MKIHLAYLLLLLTVDLFSQSLSPDNIDYKPPLIEYVTVKPDNTVYIQWTKSESTALAGYYIAFFIDTLGHNLDSVKSLPTSITLPYPLKLLNKHEITSTIDSVNKKPVRFQVQAFDINDTKSTTGYHTTYHQTIFLKIDFDSCQSQMKLTWTNYIGWKDNLAGYQIVLNGNPQPHVYGKQDTMHYIPVAINADYTFSIIAFTKDASYKSSSNTVVLNTTMSKPGSIQAQSASFINDHVVELHFGLDTLAELKNYKLYASTSPSGPFVQTDSFLNIHINPFITYDTLKALSPRYYRLMAVNYCKFAVPDSDLSTAVIATSQFSKNNILLSWNEYMHYPGQANTQYKLYRAIGNEDFTFLKSIENNTFEDDVHSLIGKGSTGDICYYVEAINSSTGDISKSSKTCIDLSGDVFIPEAFTPNDDEKNDVFIPSFAFLPASVDYHFIIYNRYGSKIFETTNPLNGWDGKLALGNKAPEGSYVYFISYPASNGKKIEKNGSFALIYP